MHMASITTQIISKISPSKASVILIVKFVWDGIYGWRFSGGFRV